MVTVRSLIVCVTSIGSGRIASARRFMKSAIDARITTSLGQYSVPVPQPRVTPRFLSHWTSVQKMSVVATSVNDEGPCVHCAACSA